MKKTVFVEGMGCPMCEAKVKKALEEVPQVQEAVVSKDTKTAVVELTDDVANEVLIEAVNGLKKFTATGVE